MGGSDGGLASRLRLNVRERQKRFTPTFAGFVGSAPALCCFSAQPHGDRLGASEGIETNCVPLLSKQSTFSGLLSVRAFCCRVVPASFVKVCGSPNPISNPGIAAFFELWRASSSMPADSTVFRSTLLIRREIENTRFADFVYHQQVYS